MRFNRSLTIAAIFSAVAIAVPSTAAYSASSKANKPVIHISYNDHAKNSRASVAFITKLPNGCVATIGYQGLATATLTGNAKKKAPRVTLVSPTVKGRYTVSAVLADSDACGKYRGITITKKVYLPGLKGSHSKPSKPARPSKSPEPTPTGSPS